MAFAKNYTDMIEEISKVDASHEEKREAMFRVKCQYMDSGFSKKKNT